MGRCCKRKRAACAASKLSRRPRGAFTLIEMLLALGILVAIAAVAAPSFTIMLADQRLRASAEEVQAAFIKARVEAMQSGRTQMFRCQLQGPQYQITPFNDASDILEAADQAGRGALATDIAMPSVQLVQPASGTDAENLPEECIFAECRVQSSARSQRADLQTAGAGDQWSQPVMFYPDGSSSFASITVAHPKMGAIDVKIRGLTGRVEISRVRTQ